MIRPRREPLFKMVNNVFSHKPNAFFSPDHCLKLCPFALKLFPGGLFLTFCNFLKFRVDLWPFFFPESELCKTCLIIDTDRCPVLYRTLNIVDADIISKDRRGVPVCNLYRSSCKTNE